MARPVATRACEGCGRDFSSEFARQRFCTRDCRLRYRAGDIKRRHAAHYQANRAKHLKAARDNAIRAYGITPQDYGRQLARQHGACIICRRKNRVSLAIDHDHSCCRGAKRSCGRCVRGLLCRDCNRVLLGRICRDTVKGTDHAIEVLDRAAAYLRRELPEQQGFGRSTPAADDTDLPRRAGCDRRSRMLVSTSSGSTPDAGTEGECQP